MTRPSYVTLDTQQHKDTGITQDPGFSHARAFNLVTIGFNEIASLSGCMPIVIVNHTKPEYTLAAVVGMAPFDNLFCGKAQWLGHAIPLSIQSHPFNYALDNQSLRVLINDADERVSQQATPSTRLFSSDGQPTSLLKHYQSILSNLVAGQQQAKAFIEIIANLNLLTPLSTTLTLQDGQEVVSNDLLTIDETRLAELEKDTVVELHEQGVLIAIHAMMLSLRQYNRLVQLSQHHENSAVKVSLKLAKD